MRLRRIKFKEERAAYHCMTRTVNGERLFDDRAKEVLRKQLWAAADFSGVEVLTYCILDNHFHVLVRVPGTAEVTVSDAELLRRYRVLYPEPTKYQVARIAVLEAVLARGGETAQELRQGLLARMHDISEFMKTVKQRFSVWFNSSHDRFGTLWAERFKSVLVENTAEAKRTVAAYIDLNPVRAGLVEDPKDYRFCGYGEAVGSGSDAACAGIGEIAEVNSYAEALAHYRQTLFGKGARPAVGKGGAGVTLDRQKAVEVIESGGRLSRAELLRCRVRYFTDGAVLGSAAFVQAYFERNRSSHGPRRQSGPRRMQGGDWGGLTVFRELRKAVIT